MYTARFAVAADENNILNLYKTVAQNVGGIARQADEITPQYVANNLHKSLANGVCVVVENPANAAEIVAEIHCYKLEPRVFAHVLSELTIVVHPDFQGRGLGKLIFTTLLEHVKHNKPDVLRVELIARESNTKAITFYQSLGFRIEGRLEKRISSHTGTLEADIPMAWLRAY